MVWKIDVLRGYIWHQRLHLLQDCWWMKRARQYIGGGEKNKDIFGSCNPAKFSRPPLLLPTYQRRAVQWAVSGGNFQQWLVTTTAHIYRRLRLVFLSVVIILSDVNYLSYFFGLRQITKIHLCWTFEWRLYFFENKLLDIKINIFDELRTFKRTSWRWWHSRQGEKRSLCKLIWFKLTFEFSQTALRYNDCHQFVQI